MHGDGDGNGGNGNGADGARPTFEQALKELGPPRDQVDQLILFVAQQGHDLAGAIETQAHGLMQLFLKEMVDLAKMQAKTTSDAVGILAEKICDLEREIVALLGSQAAEEKGRLQ